MGKWTRNLLIIALIIFIAGVGCVVGGLVAGVTSGEVQELIEKYYDWIQEKIEITDFRNEKDEPFSLNNEKENVFSCTKEEIKQIKLDLTRADLTISESSDELLWVRVETDYKNNLDVRLSQGILMVEYENESWKKDETAIEIAVPKELQLGKADVSLGAGMCRILTKVDAKEWDIECGAAVVEAMTPIVTDYFNLETGAGKTVISYLDASSDIRVKNGAGMTEIGLAGTKDQYDTVIEVAAGKAAYGQDVISGVAEEYQYRPKDAVRNLKVDCAAGSTVFTFKEGI